MGCNYYVMKFFLKEITLSKISGITDGSVQNIYNIIDNAIYQNYKEN